MITGKTRMLRSSVVIALTVALAACASSGTSGGEGAGGASGDAVTVRIVNDLVPPATITVWMVPETGARRRLGTVTPNGEETLSFAPGIRSMEHRLVAEATGGSDRTSNPFTLTGVAGLRWNVSSPNVSIDMGG
jgi:hypothetical protein